MIKIYSTSTGNLLWAGDLYGFSIIHKKNYYYILDDTRSDELRIFQASLNSTYITQEDKE